MSNNKVQPFRLSRVIMRIVTGIVMLGIFAAFMTMVVIILTTLLVYNLGS